MESEHKLRLQKMHLKLIDDVDPSYVVPFLIQEGILSDTDTDQIRNQSSRRDKMSTLLCILPKKGPKAFEMFCASLATDYEWLAKELKTIDVNGNDVQDMEAQRSREVTNEMIDFLRHSPMLQRNWHVFAHSLGLSPNRYNIQIQANIFIWSLDLCILNLIEQWRLERGKDATVGALLDALRSEKFNEIADQLERQFLT